MVNKDLVIYVALSRFYGRYVEGFYLDTLVLLGI